MALRQHLGAGFPPAGAEHREPAVGIHQKNARVVEAEFLADDVHGGMEQRIEVEDRSDVPADPRRGFQQPRPSLRLAQQLLVLPVEAGVLLQRLRELADLLLQALDDHSLIFRAVGVVLKLFPFPTQIRFDALLEFVGINGLAEVAITAGGQRAFADIRADVRRERDDGGVR